ncbi:MAG: hypothetical protein H7A36_00770 [Chlamydiales bacterium]|nr:hypothetical protein [Chlamydiales bacterium]
MKKRDLASLAVIGVSAGLMLGGCQQMQKKAAPKPQHEAAATHQMSPEMKAFYSTLSPDAQKEFMELDAHHKMMAMEMAEQKCAGKNDCKGMGGCKTANNACAGKNGCKGEGGPPVKDHDEAVHVQHNNQMNGSKH